MPCRKTIFLPFLLQAHARAVAVVLVADAAFQRALAALAVDAVIRREQLPLFFFRRRRLFRRDRAAGSVGPLREKVGAHRSPDRVVQRPACADDPVTGELLGIDGLDRRELEEDAGIDALRLVIVRAAGSGRMLRDIQQPALKGSAACIEQDPGILISEHRLLHPRCRHDADLAKPAVAQALDHRPMPPDRIRHDIVAVA